MRRANGVATNPPLSVNNITPTVSQPDVQRRDSRTYSDAPKPITTTPSTNVSPIEPDSKTET